MYIVQAGTPATDVASATRVRRRSEPADRDDESRRRTRPRVATPPPRASLAERLSLRVVTLCSGIEAVIQGYENLRVPHVHAAACDNNKHVQQMIRRNFSPNVIFPDLRLLKTARCQHAACSGPASLANPSAPKAATQVALGRIIHVYDK